MSTRHSRQQAALLAREEKIQRLRKFHVFVLSLMYRAATHGRYHDEFLLPKEMDVTLTARQVCDRFGRQCKDVFEHLFIRWHCKWKGRPSCWKVNAIVAADYVPWAQENLDATPAEALQFLKSLGAERLRRARIYTEDGPGETVIISVEEHRKLLDDSQRAIRHAWAAYVFRDSKQQAEALR